LTDWPAWPRNNRKELARYVNPEAAAQAVPPEFFRRAAARKGAASFRDLVTSDRAGAVAALYEQLRDLPNRIDYDVEPLVIEDPDRIHQVIRAPAEVLSPGCGRGTCLDLALLFAGLCLHERLAPFLVLLEDSAGREAHVLVAVDVGIDAGDWENSKAYRRNFAEGLLPGREGGEFIRRLVEGGDLVAVECTGFARSRTLKGREAREDLSWDEAETLARQRLNELDHAVTLNVVHLRYLGERAYEPHPQLAGTVPSNDIAARADEIRDFVSEAEFEDARLRLLDFARDFGSRDLQSGAAVISGLLIAWKRTEAGKLGRDAAETGFLLLTQVVELVRAVESCRPAEGMQAA
jgi:hypothetical protein